MRLGVGDVLLDVDEEDICDQRIFSALRFVPLAKVAFKNPLSAFKLVLAASGSVECLAVPNDPTALAVQVEPGRQLLS